jgi:hypothetical protein
VVAQWCGKYGQGEGVAGNAAQPAHGRHQYQPADPVRVGQREFLSQRAAERHAQDVSVGMSEGVEEVDGLAGRTGDEAGDQTGRGVAGARDVVGDGLYLVAVEGSFEGIRYFDVAAECHDE